MFADLHFTALALHGEDSQASSLGPSDSASQRSKLDHKTQQAMEALLQCVEAPSLRPSYIEKDVLWYFDDCATDTKYGNIITEANRSRPRMSIAIRRADGVKVSTDEYKHIRDYAGTIVRKLVDRIGPDPRISEAKSLTKTLIKSLFYEEFRRAILELEAEKKELRLCAGHWKAEVMLAQALLRRSSDLEGNAAKSVVSTISDLKAFPPPQLQPPPTAPPNVRDTAPTNASKRALELSPGPKSPSASHAQKRTRDNTRVSGPKTLSSLVPSRESCIPQVLTANQYLHTENKRPVACQLAPTFLSQVGVTNEEPATTKTSTVPTVPTVSVDPSGAFMLHLLGFLC